MADLADTTTQLNGVNVANGDVMDESLAVQADGKTEAKRPRVEIALASKGGVKGGAPRMVGDAHPLPTEDKNLIKIAEQIEEHLAAIRSMLESSYRG